jgi:hypothetical protein
MVQIATRRGAAGPGKAKKTLTFHIDCSVPVSDEIMEIAAFERFLMDKIKVEGKTGTCMNPSHAALLACDFRRLNECG